MNWLEERPPELAPFSLDRMERAVEKVRERLERATGALGGAGIDYAVAGGHAVAAWVGRVDESAVRNEPEIDLVVRRTDLEPIRAALGEAGFVHSQAPGLHLFLDRPDDRARDAVRLLFAGERICHLANPDVDDSEVVGPLRILSLPALVQMELAAFRDKDRMHIRDLIGIGLVDESWCARYPPELAQRLRGILETPDG